MIETGSPYQSHEPSHALVWLAAFVPVAGLFFELWLIDFGVSGWWSIVLVLALNNIMLAKDLSSLKQRNYDTGPLDSFWSRNIVPVYLFRRVMVAGGGYGYPVLWMVTFSIILGFPWVYGNGELGSISGSSRMETNAHLQTPVTGRKSPFAFGYL